MTRNGRKIPTGQSEGLDSLQPRHQDGRLVPQAQLALSLVERLMCTLPHVDSVECLA